MKIDTPDGHMKYSDSWINTRFQPYLQFKVDKREPKKNTKYFSLGSCPEICFSLGFLSRNMLFPWVPVQKYAFFGFLCGKYKKLMTFLHFTPNKTRSFMLSARGLELCSKKFYGFIKMCREKFMSQNLVPRGTTNPS
jgi:hypothetical protein